MAVRFLLTVPSDELCEADWADYPEGLDYDLVYPDTRWEVHADHDGTRTCIARVDLSGVSDFDDAFKWTVNEVRAELRLRHVFADFDDPEHMPDGPVVDIGNTYEALPCCGGCAGGDCCGGKCESTGECGCKE